MVLSCFVLFPCFFLFSWFIASNLKCCPFPQRYFGSNQYHQEVKIGLFPTAKHDARHTDISSTPLHLFLPESITRNKHSESKMLIMFHESDTVFVQVILYSTIDVIQITFSHLATQK